MGPEKKSGWEFASPTADKQNADYHIDGDDLKSFLPSGLAVAIDFICDDELGFIAQITRQLPTGTPAPRIRLLLPPCCEVELSAQTISDHYGEPVSICDRYGRLLAYREPQVGVST